MKQQYWFVGPQSDYLYNEEGKLLVNFIGRFERLQDDFNIVCSHIGLPPTLIPHVNKSEKDDLSKHTESTRSLDKFRSRWRSWLHGPIQNFKRYQDYYDIELVQFVAELYQTDIERLGYHFDSCPDQPITHNTMAGKEGP